MTESTRGYLRHPHLHGDVVAFVAEDDVWLAPLEGGRAWRLTADRAPVATPRFSPDGRSLAWTSTRDGAPEVHVGAVEGGPARRLTYWGSPFTALVGWTADGRPVAITAAGQETIRRTWAFALPLDGGEPERLPYGPIGALAFEPVPEGASGGRVLLGTHNREAAHWKRYRGGRAGRLWIGAAGFEPLHAGLDGQLECPMWVGDRIAFLSDHEGTGRLYSSLPDGSDLRAHSPAGDGFYDRQAATDGTRVVWQRAGRLWLLDDLDGAAPRPLDVAPAGPRTRRHPHPTPAAGQVETAAPDRTGRAAAVVVRGTVHWLTHRDGPARVLDETPGVRNRLARVVPGEDGAQGAVWVTDADGDDALEYAPAVLGAERRRLAAGRLGRVRALVASPDGKQLAVAAHDGRVLLVALSDGAVNELARSGDGEVSGLVFSPDSAWLAWSQPVLGPWSLRQIMLADLTSRTVSEATPQRFHDYSPAFTADGAHLAFLSVRTFDPVYDQHAFDLSFPGGTRPYLLTLAADTPSPFGPRRAGRPVGGEEDDAKDGEKEAAAVPVTRVDLEGLADRIVPFPVEAGRFGVLRAAKDGVLWTRYPFSGELGDSAASLDDEPARTALERFDLGKRRAEELLSGVDAFAVSGDGARLAVLDGGSLRIVPADQKAAEDEEADVDLERIRVTVDPAAEWRQMFDENGRLMRDNFWRADLNGVDWAGVLERYRPLVDRAGSHSDLVDLLWETVGELGTSHAYVLPPGRGTEAARRQGLLGADLVRDGEVWRVARVLPGESSDPRARSPLAAPGAAVRPGDALLAVNGRPVDPVTGPAPLLAGTADHPVELTVRGADGAERHPVVVPLDDEEALRYHDWVAGRRAAVRELSGGRLGYLHVPDMQSAGWAQLHRDLRFEMSLEGLVIDLRENRGGHTSQLIVEKLARRIVGWNHGRDLARPDPYPGDAPRGPVVALANEFSGSDGDIVNAAIQALGIGPVVGTRTWGGVIGIDSAYTLVDGTLVTQPKYSYWVEGYGWHLENRGVTPDVEVPIAPQDWAAGRDPQLETAVRLALESLERTPARTAPPLE
ncbi:MULTISPECIES: S41 family peptidase [Kitasatospora]|uniref:Tricorn protease homolog n=1 Tax=Kitasatospora setae (strain ATCC 33774 / DSM 43861 / JCM 3304 / KCC A-0304 / NBRC 14216 / KM-6054) TaxID=452652 RepID=E4NAZ7_KITSK|nr:MULTISPECIES: S41 family peptidase [Kitasatospora]BAJ28378.1 putative tricorn protease homolog [Kitasatospora setae KM-6054]